MLKDTVINETAMDKTILTVGRAASNDIVVDNLAVSSFHARIVCENGVFTLEDLNSTNGTFVNDQRISQATLNNNDSIMIGKHTLLFSDPRFEDNSDVTLNVRDRLREKTVLMSAQVSPAMAENNAIAPAKAPVVGALTVIEGPAEKIENELVGRLVTIGKSDTAEIRLKGFFAPRVAALVNKGKDGYYISPPANGRKVYVNGMAVEGRTLLANGDIVDVWKVKMQFSVREQ
jgi:pSer/pThr/pTyr-binding forkhead associated (FHA) protein